MTRKNALQTLHITCAIDDSFWFPLSVVLVSLFETNKQNKLHIHLFSASLSSENVNKFENLCKKHEQDFSFYQLQLKDFEGFPVTSRISLATYYRIIMPQYLSKDIDKYLYIDADIIVLRDLSPMFDTNLDEYVIGAINDATGIDCNMHSKHEIPETHLYFNAGILLINRKKWIEENVTEKTLNYIKSNLEKCQFHDQDALNATIFNRRLKLPPIWNNQIALYFLPKQTLSEIYGPDYIEALRKPAIVHFNGIEKPWHSESGHPFRSKFDKYVKLSGFKKPNNKTELKKWIKKNIIYKLLGWGTVNGYYYQKTKKVYQA